MAGQGEMPGWLRGLMEETFLVDCETHKSTKNMFCLHCCISFCQECMPDHRSHHFIQVRRRLGGVVARMVDLKDLINCSQIRTYASTSGELMYLRPQPRGGVLRSIGNICYFCGNNLNNDYPYCSLTCKVEFLRFHGTDISSLLSQFDASQIALTESENLQTTVHDQPSDEVFGADLSQTTPDLAPIDFVQEEGSSSGWSIGEIVESRKKK